ncbi:MAG: hypothetical protein VB878_18230 [Pirellulaceae bacterium]
MRRTIQITTCSIAITILGFVGCSDGDSGQDGPDQSNSASSNGDHDHAHHDEEGPNGGHLIDLGHGHDYHAELVEDDATETVTIFILDKDQKPLSISASSISLSLNSNGESQSFELATAGEGENAKSDRFNSTDKALFEILEQPGDLTGKLRVTIDGTPYVGNIDHHAHDHDHSTHGH